MTKGTVTKSIMTIAVLLFAAVLAYGLLATAPMPEAVEPQETATTIRVLQAKREDLQLEVVSQGSVEPRTQSELVPEVDGRVQWVSRNLVVGGYFRKDDVLLRLDDSDYRAQVARSQAALTRAQAEEELARFEHQRMEELVKNRLTSQSNLESVLRNHRIAEASLQEARISLEQANRDLARTRIKAPYDGLVRTKQVDPGQFISKGKSIASIYGSDAVEIRLPVADRQLAYLSLPLGYRGELAEELQPQATLSTEYAGHLYEWTGRLVRTEAEIDSKSRMVTAVVRVEHTQNPGRPHLPVGLFVNARIKGRWAEDIVSLPRAALRNRSRVLVVDEENRLKFRNVEVMRFDKDKVIITRGLSDGELVNISPIRTVVDGMKVNPLDRTGEA